MNRKALILLLALAFLMIAGPVFAFTAPTDPNSFGYVFYDYVVVKGLQGAIGFVIGIALVIYGATFLPQGKYMTGFIAIITGGLIAAADKVVTGFGLIC
ncbi:hypothetical protein EDC39_11283 [Geothermobacter ehrlichii]|uniref:Type IV secretion system protein VirB2 n=1 Tax=Geothermobacter ehrlichii TaxID=213224 RepID=A0A5D3WGX6_9BACT|nr:hypothetical protein [Geothermobacter ehrlichii]TYO96795.1 hypothetical protein EDC39_11283 [Geothermobacter ehrlichii]